MRTEARGCQWPPTFWKLSLVRYSRLHPRQRQPLSMSQLVAEDQIFCSRILLDKREQGSAIVKGREDISGKAPVMAGLAVGDWSCSGFRKAVALSRREVLRVGGLVG